MLIHYESNTIFIFAKKVFKKFGQGAQLTALSFSPENTVNVYLKQKTHVEINTEYFFSGKPSFFSFFSFCSFDLFLGEVISLYLHLLCFIKSKKYKNWTKLNKNCKNFFSWFIRDPCIIVCFSEKKFFKFSDRVMWKVMKW